MTPPRIILGINVSHDRSAFIVRDGIPICGIAEERLDRKKHSIAISPDGSYLSTLPQKAIDYVLEAAGIELKQCDAIVVCGSVVYHPQKPLRNLTVQDVVSQLPQVIDVKKVSVLNHHLAHAIGAYSASPFDEAAILVADGAGNLIGDKPSGIMKISTVEHTTFYHVESNRIDELHKVVSGPRYMNSLGAMYQLVTLFCGFGMFQEGKTMGLAPYGRPTYIDMFSSGVELGDDLSYHLAPWLQTFDIRGRQIPASFIKKFGQPRHYNEPLRQSDKDLAYAVQYTIENILVHLATKLQQRTGSDNLVLAGGVALNSVANQMIAERAGFTNVFIVPCAADDGTALGAAMWPWLQNGGEKRWAMRSASLGRNYSANEYERTLQKYKHVLKWRKPENLVEVVVSQIAAGAIVGWHQGGAEIGPRALGNRSILCDPRRAENKDVLNEKVKYRESFRPFAPVVPMEFAEEYFDLKQESPFMLRVAKCKKTEQIPAAIHVDGTGRVQTVNATDNRLLHDLIIGFQKQTGVPVLLNTSFNLAGDPIVETPEDAIDCFLKSEMDMLVLGEFVVEKQNPVLCRELAAKHRELLTANRRIVAQEAELESIRQSRGWRLLNWINRIRR